MQCSISIIYCHYYYYSLTYKTVIISIAHVMKKQEVRFTSAHAQCSGKPLCKLLSMCGSQLTSCFFITCAMEITIQFEYV